MDLSCTINGDLVERTVEPQEFLLDFLREDLGLTGTKRSCEVQVCGACTVLLDGLPVSACCTLACEIDGRRVTTIEGLGSKPGFVAIEQAFTNHAAVQCGFCSPGMVLTVAALLRAGELGSEAEIRHALRGNLCRCTGYKGIVEAVSELAGVEP